MAPQVAALAAGSTPQTQPLPGLLPVPAIPSPLAGVLLVARPQVLRVRQGLQGSTERMAVLEAAAVPVQELAAQVVLELPLAALAAVGQLL